MYSGVRGFPDRSSQDASSREAMSEAATGGAANGSQADCETLRGDEVGENAWLKAMEDEISASNRTPPPSATARQRSSPDPAPVQRQIGGTPGTNQASRDGDGGWSSAVGNLLERLRVLVARIGQQHGSRRIAVVMDRLRFGMSNCRNGFRTLPRGSRRWVWLAGIAGASAILWGLSLSPERGQQSAATPTLLAPAQVTSEELKRQVEQLSAELRFSQSAREQLRAEVAALTEQRDWLAARLDGLAIEDDAKNVGSKEVMAQTHPAPRSLHKKPDTKVVNNGYQVQKGDTLWRIAQQHDVDVTQLAAANGIDVDGPLKAGQQLVVPVSTGEGGAVVGSPPEKVGAIAKAKENGNTGRKVEYKVQRGDSLYGISRRFEVSVDQLRRWNGLDKDDLLRPSQRLVVYLASTDGASMER